MADFRKKSVVIQASLFDGVRVGDVNDGVNVLADSCPDWFPAVSREIPPGHVEDPRVGEVIRRGTSLLIGTLEGTMVARPGDWIIRRVDGELRPCKRDIFEATYDPA